MALTTSSTSAKLVGELEHFLSIGYSHPLDLVDKFLIFEPRHEHADDVSLGGMVKLVLPSVKNLT
jgi:hypothetical protein